MARFRIEGTATVTYDDVFEAENLEEALKLAQEYYNCDGFEWEQVYRDDVEPDFDNIEEI